MKRLLIIMIMVLSMFTSNISAQDSNVTYSGNAGDFIFEPGSNHSLTDLFPNFKDVMPGDVLSQKITVKNNASKNIHVKIYLRSLGAHEESKDFLSKLKLNVVKSSGRNSELFEGNAAEKGDLNDWVLLGTLYSGGEVELDVELTVPVELDNTYMDQIAYLDWEFMVEEYPAEVIIQDTSTYSGTNIYLYGGVIGISLIVLLLFRRRKVEE